MRNFTKILLILISILLLVGCGKKDDVSVLDGSGDKEKATSTNLANEDVLGRYECTGSDMQGTKLDPGGEWLELKADGTGAWFLGAMENTFNWTLKDKKFNFKLDVGLDYKGSLENDEIIVDTGML